MLNVTITAADGSDFGGRFRGYLAEPAGTAKAPGLVVILEIRGVNANLRAICDDYAARGYLALAPDVLWRVEPGLDYDPDTPEGWDKAMRINAEFKEDQGVEDLKTAQAWLRRHPRCNGLAGAVGYCLGGKLAYLLAARGDSDATVGYYGIGIEKVLAEKANMNGPFLLHMGEQDRFVPPEAQRALAEGLGAAVHFYPGADHAFARKDGVRYAPEAAALADRRSHEFFERTLLRAG
jgi:carboxymethylenebutenolidase